jgi:hypothetical protein
MHLPTAGKTSLSAKRAVTIEEQRLEMKLEMQLLHWSMFAFEPQVITFILFWVFMMQLMKSLTPAGMLSSHSFSLNVSSCPKLCFLSSGPSCTLYTNNISISSFKNVLI